MAASHTNRTFETEPLAHGGSHGLKDTEPQHTPTPSPIETDASVSDELTLETDELTESLQPPSVATGAQPTAKTQANLVSSIMGLPLGLGELSLGLVLAGPVCLFALKRWLQS